MARYDRQDVFVQVLRARCAVLDVHKDTVVACVRCVSSPMHRRVRSLGTTTAALLELADWLADRLAEHDCARVAMEATGVDWKPVWHVLEAGFERDLNRTRKQGVRKISQHALRIQKVLEDANLELGSGLSDVLCKSWRAMLDAIAAGQTDPAFPAALAQATARNKTAELCEALRGRITDHRRTMLRLHLQVLDAPQRTPAELDAAVATAPATIQQRARLLTTMPGISDLRDCVVVAEIGVDMSRFPTVDHLMSWAGLCPCSDESAGKRRSNPVRKRGTWIKTTLVTAARAAVRVKTSDLRAQFLPIKARRGAKKALLALAASMLTAALHT